MRWFFKSEKSFLTLQDLELYELKVSLSFFLTKISKTYYQTNIISHKRFLPLKIELNAKCHPLCCKVTQFKFFIYTHTYI